MFELNKVVLTKYGGLEIGYVKSEDEQAAPVEYKIKSISAPHPDLVEIFGNMRGYVMAIFGWDDEKQAERIKVQGVEYTTGNGIILHWQFMAANGTVTNLVTPRIKLDSKVFGFEDELAETAQQLHEETYAYIKGKRAQLELFGQTDEDEILLYEQQFENNGTV